jgi:hypothetical protein
MTIQNQSNILNLEWTWLKKPNFFPSRSAALQPGRSICIGTKSRNLGDALLLTSLARALKTKDPHLKIFTFGRAFNPVVFYSNPYIEKVQCFPNTVFGDDCNWGSGHTIAQKEAFFNLTLSPEPSPELFMTQNEMQWTNSVLAEKPLCLLHCSGVTWKNLLPNALWENIIRAWKNHYHFVQVGMTQDIKIDGAQALLLPADRWNARRLFALMKRTAVFLGIDSGPMHVARAFAVPSLIFISGAEPAEIFQWRKTLAYYTVENRKYGTLYEQNTHIRADKSNPLEVLKKVDDFLSARLPKI